MEGYKAYSKQYFYEDVFDGRLGEYLQYQIVLTPDPINLAPYDIVYSLLVLKLGEMGDSESCFVYDVTRTVERAINILGLLCDNRVTPCTVRDVLEELI